MLGLPRPVPDGIVEHVAKESGLESFVLQIVIEIVKFWLTFSRKGAPMIELVTSPFSSCSGTKMQSPSGNSVSGFLPQESPLVKSLRSRSQFFLKAYTSDRLDLVDIS